MWGSLDEGLPFVLSWSAEEYPQFRRCGWMRLMMSFLLLLAFGVAWPAVAQTANNEKASLETEVQGLRKRISVLEQEFRVVEERLRAAAPAPVPTQAVASEIPSDSQNDTKSSLPVDVSGYLSLRYFNDTSSEGVGSFQAHDVSLFFGKKLGNWRYFSEIEFEYAPGHSAAENSFSSARGLVMVETAWLNYTHRDWLKEHLAGSHGQGQIRPSRAAAHLPGPPGRPQDPAVLPGSL